MLQTVQKTCVNVSLSADGNTICIIKTLCSMHCLSSITFTEFLSKSLLCLYLSYKQRLQPQRHWTLNSLSQIFGFWSWATSSDIQCHPFKHVQSLSHNSLIWDLFDWWKVKLVVLHVKSPHSNLKKTKKEKLWNGTLAHKTHICICGGPWGLFEINFFKSYWKIILTNKFLHFASHSLYNIYILYMVICLLILL